MKLIQIFLLEFYRASVREDSIITELVQRHGAHTSAHNSLQMTITSDMPGGEQYDVTVSKDPGAEHFHVERVFRSNRYLAKVKIDLVCLER